MRNLIRYNTKLDASCLKTPSTANLKIKQTRSAFLSKLREVKRRAKDDDASNKSMDVRRKQRLCLERRPLSFRLSLAVSAHVISAVVLLSCFNDNRSIW